MVTVIFMINVNSAIIDKSRNNLSKVLLLHFAITILLWGDKAILVFHAFLRMV